MIGGFPKVRQMKSAKGGSVANHFIIETNRYTFLQSYDSLVVRVHKRSGRVSLDRKKWNYSKTTSRYRNLFLNATTKEIKFRIKTGEYKLRNLNE